MTTSEKVPTYALCYLVNGDSTSLTDEEIEMIDTAMSRIGAKDVIPCDTEPYFSAYPLFGLATEVQDCIITL
ncbi:MAG: hypothetical protein LIO91_01830 [Bacteroidales bacterium]|nr:hypothetical protein [Bacteroidales bacterium]